MAAAAIRVRVSEPSARRVREERRRVVGGLERCAGECVRRTKGEPALRSTPAPVVCVRVRACVRVCARVLDLVNPPLP